MRTLSRRCVVVKNSVCLSAILLILPVNWFWDSWSRALLCHQTADLCCSGSVRRLSSMSPETETWLGKTEAAVTRLRYRPKSQIFKFRAVWGRAFPLAGAAGGQLRTAATPRSPPRRRPLSYLSGIKRSAVSDFAVPFSGLCVTLLQSWSGWGADLFSGFRAEPPSRVTRWVWGQEMIKNFKEKEWNQSARKFRLLFRTGCSSKYLYACKIQEVPVVEEMACYY